VISKYSKIVNKNKQKRSAKITPQFIKCEAFARLKIYLFLKNLLQNFSNNILFISI